jgi:hypothetical protein
MLEVKPGVSLVLLRPQILIALRVLEALFDDEGVACVITSGDDGTHKQGSKHYGGDALDIRTRTITQHKAQLIVQHARRALGSSFTVLLEHDHIHVQYTRPQAQHT